MNNSGLHNESELFSRIAAGDETAFAAIFHYYNRRLFPGVVKILRSEAEAEEVVQNTFLKLWLNRHQLPEIEKPGAWLSKIASNFALNVLRNNANYKRHTELAGNSNHAEDDGLHRSLDAKELKGLIAEAVSELPAGRQLVFKMSRYEGLNRQEIAQKLGVTESTVKNQLTSSLKFIQNYLVKKHGIHLPLIIFLLFN